MNRCTLDEGSGRQCLSDVTGVRDGTGRQGEKGSRDVQGYGTPGSAKALHGFWLLLPSL